MYVVKEEIDKVTISSFKASTSLNRSLFTIVAEPYKPVDEILIIIL
jgi:glutamate formiminotransferase